jgi:hypothetical protein
MHDVSIRLELPWRKVYQPQPHPSLRAASLPQLLSLFLIDQCSNAKLLRIPLSRKQGAPHELAPLLRINDQRLLARRPERHHERFTAPESPRGRTASARRCCVVLAACESRIAYRWLCLPAAVCPVGMLSVIGCRR